MNMMQTIRKHERQLDLRMERFLWRHPFLGFLSIFVGMPVLILICVCISTMIIALPVVWWFGYL